MPASTRRPSSGQSLRDWVEQALLRAELFVLKPLCMLSALLMSVAAVIDAVTLHGSMRPVVIAHDVASALLSAVAALANPWLSRHPRWIRPVVAVVGVLLLSNTILTLGVTRDMVVVAHTVVFFAGLARVTTSLRWLLAVLVPSAVACAVVAAGVATPEQAGNLGIVIVGVIGLAIVMVVTRRRAQVRLATSAYRSGRRHARVVRALTQAETELAQRKVVEAEREALRGELLQAQKMQAIGTLAGGVAHDMNNILAVIQSSSEAMKEEAPSGSPLAADVDTVLLAVRRGADLTRNLLTFARKEKRQSLPVPVGEVISDVRALLARTLPKELTLETHVDQSLTVLADRNMLHHAIMNLCLNAADAMMAGPRHGRVELSAERREIAGRDSVALGLPVGSYAVVTVRDTGVGMTDDVRSRAFEPFFSTKPTGKGTGLGLAMVYGAAQAHDGVATIESIAGKGTTVRLFLPDTTAAPVSRPNAESEPAPAARGRRVLVVDDESLVRRAMRRLLERAGVEVVEAEGGAFALEAIGAGRAFDAVVLDMAMPNMTGAECFWRLREASPNLPVLIASGHSRTADVERLLAETRVEMLEKPFERRQLLGALERLYIVP